MKQNNYLSIKWLIILFWLIIGTCFGILRSKNTVSQFNYRSNRVEPASVIYPEKVAAEDVFGNPNFVSTSLFDSNIQSYIYFSANQKSQATLEYKFKNPSDPKLVKINFGDTEPKKIVTEALIENKWKIIDSKTGFSKDVLDILISDINRPEIESLKFSFSQSIPKSEIKITELQVIEKFPQNIVEKYSLNLTLTRSPLAYILYSIIIFLSIFIIGVSIATIIFKEVYFNSVSIIRASALGIFSIMLVGALEIMLPTFYRGIISIIFVIFSSLYLLTRKKILISCRLELLICILFSIQVGFFIYLKDQNMNSLVHSLDVQTDNTDSIRFPYGLHEMDYILPFSQAKMFYYGVPEDSILKNSLISDYQLSDRTPLLSFFSVPYLILFGDRFFIFENIMIGISGLFILSSFILAKHMFNNKIAIVSIIILSMNHYLLFIAHINQTKIVLAFSLGYFMYSAFKEYETKNKLDLWLSSVVSFLIHPLAIIYIFAVGTYQLFTFEGNLNKKIRNLLQCYFPLILLFATWLILNVSSSNDSLLYSLSFKSNWQKADISTLNTFFYNRLANFQGFFLANPIAGITRTWGPIRTTLPGLIGLLPIFFLSIGTFFLTKKKKNIKIIYISLLTLFLLLLYFGTYSIWGMNQWLVPLLPLVIPIVAWVIVRLKQLFQLIFFLLIIIEHYYVTWVKFENGFDHKSIPFTCIKILYLIYILITLATILKKNRKL